MEPHETKSDDLVSEMACNVSEDSLEAVSAMAVFSGESKTKTAKASSNLPYLRSSESILHSYYPPTKLKGDPMIDREQSHTTNRAANGQRKLITRLPNNLLCVNS